MQRITGLPEEQVLAYEAQAEAIMRAALSAVMDKIAARIEASVPVLASALVGADPPAEEPLPPGQPYVSPDDLASIPPLWQEAVAEQLVPIAAEVFFEAAARTYANMVEASSIAGLPSVGSLAAEQYLAQARNTFEQVGDDLWATARTQLVEGFEQGESIPELATRLRQSAGITARRAVLVARTQVNEASNAGSFAVAQASGLKVKKTWFATNDIRTRPEHMDAEDRYREGASAPHPGPIDLNEPFIVGGFSAMFPAAPSLPPSMRFNCRCAIGYVMPDRAPAQVRADDLATQQLEDLPGTTSPIDEQHARVEQVIQDVHQRFGETFPKGAGPGFDLPARGENPPSYVRPSLREAKTPRQLRRVWQDEVESITGFPFVVDAMPRGISMVTAREYAEGTLQMFAQFPGAKVDRIHWFDDAASSAYAHVRRGGHAIEFNMRYASEAARPKFLAARRKDVAGWDDPTLGTSWSVRNDLGGQGVVYHEFTHILDIENGREAIHSQLVPLLIRHAEVEGVTDIEDLIKRRISSYAASARGSMQELVAEAGTDVMVNGAAASQLSRDIFDLVRAEYRRRGFEIRTAPTAAVDDLGEILPKPEGPGPGLTVRPALEAARTTGAVERAFNDEFQRITGRRPQSVQFAGSAATAREHAEGLLRGMERFPDADLSAVSSVGVEAATTYAHAIGSRIAFNYEWTRPDRRKKYLDSLQRDVAGWEQGVQEWGVGIFRASSFHPRGTGSPIAVALHEFGHIIDVRTTAQAIRPQLDELLKLRTAQAIRRGRPAPETPIIDQEDLIFREISSYATKNHNELVAEAFADVMMNGGAASTLSREIFDLLEAEYRRRGGVVRAAPLIDEVFPSQAMPRVLSVRSMTVADLRAELTARGVAIPAKARKADLVREVEAARAATPVAPRALSTQTVAQLRALAKERGIVVPVGARKADLVKALSDETPSVPTASVGRSIDELARETPIRVTPLEGGITAKVDRLDYADGQSAVRKDYLATRKDPESRTAQIFAEHATRAEDLAADVLRVVGVRRPDVIQINDHTILMDFVEGVQGGETGALSAPAAVLRSIEGRRLGLADALMGHRDRGGGNWMRQPDGGIVAIDNGGAFGGIGPDRAAAGNPFTSFLMGRYEESPWKARIEIPQSIDLAEIRRGLLALRSKFDDLGHQREFKDMLGRLDEIERRAVRVPDPPSLVRVTPALDEKALLRAAARERNRLIESSQGTARLLAEVDELIANKATKAAIRQRLDPALVAPEQVYAGADPAIVEALRTALDTGDPAKLRAALTRAGTKSKLKPISKAGAKAKFDAETMEGVGGIDIPAGAQVTVVRRGTTLTLPDGSTMQLTRAQVTPVAQVAQAATRAPAAIQARQAQLRIDAARPTLPDKSRRQSGQNAYTTQVEHEGGPPTVTKDFSRLGEGPAASKRRADAEELGALVSESTGIRAPAVIRTGPRSVEMEFIEGKPGDEFLQWGQSASDVGLTGTDDGRLLGLADILMGNMDRNAGNFIRMADGHLAAIDHETAFGPAKLAGAGDRFGADLIGREDFKDAKWPASIDINPADLVVIRERLEALAPEFDRLGRSIWHRQVMARLVEVEKRASASAPVRLPGLAPQPMTSHEFDATIKAAAKGEKALSAVPYSTTGRVYGPDYQQDALDRYRLGPDINDALRGLTGRGREIRSSARHLSDIRDVDQIFDGSRLTRDVELWRSPGSGRGIFGNPSAWGDDLTGYEWIDPAYSSTSASRIVADRFGKNDGVRLRILAPKGSKAIQLSDLGFEGVASSYANEAEILLARGARFRVVKDRGWTEITHPTTHQKIRVRDLDVEVIVPEETPPLPWATN